MIIDLDKQFDEFYSRLDYYPLSQSAISLYMAILQIAKRKKWMDNLKIANSILSNKSGGLSPSALMRARNELIQNGYIYYKKGCNQNDLSRYTIICLYEQVNEQANEQPNEQPNTQADEQAREHNKLNYTKLYYYLININKKGGSFLVNENRMISEAQGKGIVQVIKQLNLYVESDLDTLTHLMGEKKLYYLLLQYYAIQELYFGPFNVYLKYLTEEVFINKFDKSIKYCKDVSDPEEILSYFIASLQNYFSYELVLRKDDE